MKYWIGHTCKNCGHKDRIELTKEQLAFGLYDRKAIEQMACSQCGTIQSSLIHHQFVKIDKALLDQWGHNANLFFLEQDEELILAEEEYLPMLLEAIDVHHYLPRKITTLIEALCILLYDNTANSEEYSWQMNQERELVANKVRQALLKRKELIRKASPSIRDYVKEVVFPQINLNQTNNTD